MAGPQVQCPRCGKWAERYRGLVQCLEWRCYDAHRRAEALRRSDISEEEIERRFEAARQRCRRTIRLTRIDIYRQK